MSLRNFFRQLLFLQSSHLILKARTDVLQESDLLQLPERLDPKASRTVEKLLVHLKPLQFILNLAKVYKIEFKKAYFFYSISIVASLISPVLIHNFVAGLQSGENFEKTLVIGLILAVSGVLSGLSLQHFFVNTLAANQLITNDLNQLIFRQSLELSLEARTHSQVGDIVNYMSSDTESISDMPIVLGDLGWALITIVVATAQLFYYIGWSAFPAIAIMAGLVPMTKKLALKFVHFEEKMMSQRDSRITLMSQLLSQIRVIKYFAWEKAVSKEVGVLRSAEMESRKKLAQAESISSVSYIAVSSLVLFVALLTHALRGLELDSATIFTCIALFGLLEEPFGNLSRLFSRMSQALVSSQRILDFLQTKKVHVASQVLQLKDETAFEFQDVSLGYQKMPIVQNVNLKIRKGSSLAIVGPVGAGKSTLLYGLLNECHVLNGQYLISEDLKKRAYVPQEAYIVNGSLLENVVFGESKLNKELLRKSLHQACLEKDIQDLPAGLRTEIGEKGVNLSGGQKQRVSLARAAYIQPDWVLLDDPLSAVDFETERQLCERLIFGQWEQEKVTRVVVTHRLEFLNRFDQILFLKEGKVQGLGDLSELLRSNSEFREFYHDHEKSQTQLSHPVASEISVANDSDDETRITVDEEREKGAVKATVYWDYILSLRGGGGQRNAVLWLLGFVSVLATVTPLLQKGWISNYQKFFRDLTTLQAVWIYGALGILVLLSNLGNSLYWINRGLAAGRNFHDRMLQSVLRAPVRFFDSTPVGRVLQRFSRDLESVDIYMQRSFSSFIQCVLNVAVSLLLVLSALPYMIFVIAPTLWFYNRMQQDYRRPAREAKRFDSIARSPRFAHFKETLMGLVVIRAFDKRDWFLQDFFRKLSHSQRMFYGHYMLNRWFSARVPVIAGVISISTLAGISYSVHQSWITAGVGGLVTIYALTFWGQLNWGIRIFADIESRMTSVERLKFYSNLESEKTQGSIEPDPAWPSRGEVEIQNLQVRYAPHLPLVLKGLNVRIQAGHKVGIVGRTGSGKTTLFQSLYRFVEASEGHILIDGVDISKVGLDRLRESLAIVPQDPSLFLGTLRSNLDRYQEYSDEAIWQALSQSGLADFVQSLSLKLETPVAENGSNFSQGQRQLLCLARALLIQAKVILMDEATASVDVQTDLQIQKIIREKLRGVTMLIIAHRLGTVSDCDQVIEMSNGVLEKIHETSQESKKELEALLEKETSS